MFKKYDGNSGGNSAAGILSKYFAALLIGVS